MEAPMTLPNPNDTAKPVFYVRSVQNNFETEKQGRAVFMNVEWVDIIVPGDMKSRFSSKVTEEHRNRWPLHYQAFKNKQEAPVSGTPIEQWPVLTPAQVDELKSYNIKTIEEMAALNETYLDAMGMGSREMQVKARAYLEAAAGTADVQKLRLDIDRKDKEIAELKRQISELSARFGEDETGKPARRSRKEAA
jgi:hypothetical protein